MTDQEINEAIAELCGWKQIQNACGDLNEMHDVEKALNAEQRILYYYELLSAITGRYTRKESDFAFLSATARQRAEAFLRVHGKWKE